jgi:hypothetical protein
MPAVSVLVEPGGFPLDPGRVTPALGPVSLPEPSEVPFPGRFGDSYFLPEAVVSTAGED